MAQFLRDEIVKNLTIDKECLLQIATVFANRIKSLDTESKENKFFFYIIRFDNKGHRLFSIDDLLANFDQAKRIERVIFTIETGRSLSSNRNIGAHFELRLDAKDPNNCYISVTADDSDWVDASFSAVNETLEKFRNKNFWARTAWMDLCIQLGGVFFGFVLSLWAAFIISPKLTLENSFVITFLFAFLIFSNTWTYFKSLIIQVVNLYFPNIKFYRPSKDRLHWLMQAVIGGISAAIAIYLLSKGFSFIGNILGDLSSKNL